MPRKSITPPPIKDWANDISNAIDQEMEEFNDLDDSVQKRIRIIVRQKNNVARERDHYKSRAEELKYDKESLVGENRVLKSKLSVRPHVEILQRKTIPAWLLNSSSIKSATQWTIAIEFELTVHAKILRKRWELYLKSHITIEELGFAFANFYDAASEVINHDKKPKQIDLDASGWNQLFHELNMNDPEEQLTVRKMLEPIPLTEIDQAKQNPHLYKSIVFLKHATLFSEDMLDMVSEELIWQNILQYCEDFGPRMSHYYYPKTSAQKYLGGIYFVFDGSTKEINDLKSLLESKLGRKTKEEKKTLKFIYNSIK